MTVTIYGIRNCDTMKKAFDWLQAEGIAHDFHDYKKDGIDAATLRDWAGKVGWEVLLNRAGTTFRKLADEEKAGLDEAKAIALMAREPSMIKRPVFVKGDAIGVGFKPEIGSLDFLKR